MYLFKLLYKGLVWDGGSDSVEDEDQTAADDTSDDGDDDFEAWLEKEHPDIFKKYSSHTDNLVSALRKERKANKDSKKEIARLKAYEKTAQQQQQEELTEVERVKTVNADLTDKLEKQEAANKALRIEHALLTAAAKYDFQDANDVLLYADREEIEIDEKGKVTGADEAVKAVAKSRVYLLKKKLESDNDNDTDDGDKDKLDKTPEKQRKIREAQPKIPI